MERTVSPKAASPSGRPLLEPAVPYHLPTSSQGRCASFNIVVAATVAVAALASAVAVPQEAILDPLAFGAFAYIYGLFCFQNTFLEWPELDLHLLLLLLGAAAALVLPSALAARGLWDVVLCRLASLAWDAALVVGAYRKMVRGPVCDPPAGSLKGNTCIITGCNTGIGLETAEALARAGARVVFACRSEARARDAMRLLLRRAADAQVAEDQLLFLPLDLSSLKSVRTFAELVRQAGLRVDLLILNAGVMLSSRSLSEDGLEMTMASNHYGHFLLVHLLLPNLLEAEAGGAKPRIVVVSSNLCYKHDRFDFSEAVAVPADGTPRGAFLQRPYEMFRAYAQSKLANVLFTAELARRLRSRGSQIPVNAIHPGEVLTEVMRDMHPALVWLTCVFRPVACLFIKTPRQGSYNTLHVATDPSLATSAGASGGFFVRCAAAPVPDAGLDEVAAERLWAISEKLTGAA